MISSTSNRRHVRDQHKPFEEGACIYLPGGNKLRRTVHLILQAHCPIRAKDGRWYYTLMRLSDGHVSCRWRPMGDWALTAVQPQTPEWESLQ